MSEMERLRDQLRRSIEGSAWHGPALREVLAGVTAEAAAARPIEAAHSIWELVLHVSAWQDAVRRRLASDAAIELTPAEDWPTVSDSSPSTWQKALDGLERMYLELERDLAALDDRVLDRPVPGMGYNVYVMLHGVVQHNLYHAGQIALLKKASLS